jgi:hypothetical protein
MRALDSMNGKAIGLGFAVYLALFVVGLLIVGMHPSDTEMHLAVWPAAAAGFAVTMHIAIRDSPDEDK